tara:strand:- start:96 stop:221 length:126 start_codon:yes stop_codon:yes gene_type:complete
VIGATINPAANKKAPLIVFIFENVMGNYLLSGFLCEKNIKE